MLLLNVIGIFAWTDETDWQSCLVVQQCRALESYVDFNGHKLIPMSLI